MTSFLWFVAAVVVCGAHAIYIRGWRRERRQQQAWWQQRDAESQRRHDEFMLAMRVRDAKQQLDAFMRSLDPATQKIIGDFDAHSKRRAIELLGQSVNDILQKTREIAFCLGYKAGVIDIGVELRREVSVGKGVN